MRPFVTVTALALALLPAAAFAQTPPPQQPPPTTPPAGQTPAAPATPAAPKLTFTGTAGLLLVQIKPDQTAAFEEMVAKLRGGIATTTDAALKASTTGFKVYKASEPMAGNALYVVVVDPVTPSAEYDFFMMLQKTMTPEQLRDPATTEMFKKWSASFAAGYNQLNLTPIGR
jgi:hypothetical protein